jgi:hypothetical protein
MILWITVGLKEYLFNEWKYNVHKRYLKYFDEWYDNLLDSQKEFYKSWMEGYMSPYH